MHYQHPLPPTYTTSAGWTQGGKDLLLFSLAIQSTNDHLYHTQPIISALLQGYGRQKRVMMKEARAR